MEQTWKRKEYDSWDDAFMGLAPAVRQQSVRVAAYTRVLFIEASATEFGKNIPGGAQRMNGKYADLAYKCGLYHQLGKALVPAEYQIWQADFTDEEQAVYRKYTADGRLLVASLQEKSLHAREKRTGKDRERHTDNIPFLMVRESCGQHMERYDGSGYPEGRIGDAISPIAQIVGLAKELDRLSSETRSENPFKEAVDKLVAQADKAFSPELIEVLKASKAKCRAVYNKYIQYTMTLPKTIPLVDKRKDRPMGLTYRAMTNGTEGSVVAYEATPWFGGVLGSPDEKETAKDLDPLLAKAELSADMGLYLLYEAADTLLRIQNCKLQLEYLLVNLFPSFYKTGNQLPRLLQLFEHQPVDRSKLLLALPQGILAGASKTAEEIFRRYMKNGVQLLLDDWDPAQMPLEKVQEYGLRYLRPSGAALQRPDILPQLLSAKTAGCILFASGADEAETLQKLTDAGVGYMSGTLTGGEVDEEELIRDSLLRESGHG